VIGLVTVVTGQTNEIIPLAVFGALTLYILSAAALLRLRVREPALARPYRTPLYPLTPIIAIGLSAICMGAMVWAYPWIAAVYAGLIGGSWMLFALFVPPERRVSFES
jgi:ethanolamine permease